MRRSDNPEYVEGFVGFSISKCGEFIHANITDWKDSIRDKPFAYRIRIKIPQEVLDAPHELEVLEDAEVVSKLTIETIETEVPIEEEPKEEVNDIIQSLREDLNES